MRPIASSGSANKVILPGTTSPWLLCQLAPSRITTAWASAATWLLISLRWWFIAAVLQIGMISAAALPCDGQTAPNNRPRRSRDLLAPPADCRFAPIPGSSCSSGRCEPRPGTISRLAHRVVALPGLALIAIQQLRKLRLRCHVGLRVARPRHQPAQLDPMQQPVGARQAALNIKLLFQDALRVDPPKCHHPVRLRRQSVP